MQLEEPTCSGEVSTLGAQRRVRRHLQRYALGAKWPTSCGTHRGAVSKSGATMRIAAGSPQRASSLRFSAWEQKISFGRRSLTSRSALAREPCAERDRRSMECGCNSREMWLTCEGPEHIQPHRPNQPTSQ